MRSVQEHSPFCHHHGSRPSHVLPGMDRGFSWSPDRGKSNAFSSLRVPVCRRAPTGGIRGGNTDDNGRLFYAVYSKCGALPCPPYEDGKTLSCSVCMM
ncbi:hypothetical protein KP79_PYT14487 [Mizuhopecten yessoensis]|uniref:Uncharacterized protein n=1 Tax=Mizuhopecten yessoensis TaxID=6573 RepID=A0A210QHF5_MIZYE|nr:hypothetical protein KP79_PYT14487 [Mizuhopecten yessoensis]